ncbi:hypothetical protein [Saccharopolyspora pogona]|uniref:hypothetical protein n=1 Tax=Saccharopolyspora pogona TaxID=333966 RepID=UPI0016874202|nr:hypothetical protein [Saccharopolyspora pogona]
MYPHHHTPDGLDDPSRGDDDAASIIPLPRTAPDDHIENLPKIVPGQTVWQHDQKRTRGDDRHFTGHVTRVGGSEGEKLRGELADAIGDLLRWARTQ